MQLHSKYHITILSLSVVKMSPGGCFVWQIQSHFYRKVQLVFLSPQKRQVWRVRRVSSSSSSSFFLQLSVKQWDPMPQCSPLSGQVLPLCHRVSSPEECGLNSARYRCQARRSPGGGLVYPFEGGGEEAKSAFFLFFKNSCAATKTGHLGQKPAEPKTRVGDARPAHLLKALEQESTQRRN